MFNKNSNTTFKKIFGIILSFIFSFSIIFFISLNNSQSDNNKKIIGVQNASVIPDNTKNEFREFFNNASFAKGSYLYNIANEMLYADTGIKDTETLIQENQQTGSNDPQMMLDLYAYDSSKHSWTLRLHSYNWGGLNLGDLKIFGNFINIVNIEFQVDKDPSSNYLGEAFDLGTIVKLSWLENFAFLHSLKIQLNDNIANYSESINLEAFAFVENTQISKIDVSTLININGTSLIDGTFYDKSWFRSRDYNFSLSLPSRYDATANEDLDITWKLKDSNEILIVEKITIPTLNDPSFLNNDPIYIDGKKIEAWIISSKWYWVVEDLNDLKDITWGNHSTRRYYTLEPLDPDVDYWLISKRTDNYNDYKIKQELEKQIVPVPSNTIIDKNNYNAILDYNIKIDGQEYEYNLFDKEAVFSADLSNIDIQYATNSRTFFTNTKYLTPIDIENGVFTISDSQNNNTRPLPKWSDLVPDPIDINDKIYWDNNSIEIGVKIINGNFEWDFPSNSGDFQNVKYFTKTNLRNEKRLATDLKYILNSYEDAFPDDVSEFSGTPNSPPSKPAVEDPGPLTNDTVSKLSNKIRIIDDDGKLNIIEPVIRNSFIYWNYDDISNIKYVVEKNVDGENVNHYYTSYEVLVSDANDLAIANSVLRTSSRGIPKKSVIKNPILKQGQTQDNIKIVWQQDNIKDTYFSVIRSGKLYWNLPLLETINNIKYVIINNNQFTYYHDLPTWIPEGFITEIEPPNYKQIPAALDDNFLSIKNITKNNFESMYSGFIVDNIPYNLKFSSSVVLWGEKGIAPTNINYTLNFQDPNNNAFTTNTDSFVIESLNKYSEINRPILKQYDKFTDFDEITNPNEGDVLTMMLDTRENPSANEYVKISSTTAGEPIDTYKWLRYEDVIQLKYKWVNIDTKEIYYTKTMFEKAFENNARLVSSITIDPDLLKYSKINDINIIMQRVENKNAFITLFITIGGSAGLSLFLGIYYIIKIKRRIN